MNYYANVTDNGIVVCAFSATEPPGKPWRRLIDPWAHVNDAGFAKLDSGGTILFTQIDQSYPALAALFV